MTARYRPMRAKTGTLVSNSRGVDPFRAVAVVVDRAQPQRDRCPQHQRNAESVGKQHQQAFAGSGQVRQLIDDVFDPLAAWIRSRIRSLVPRRSSNLQSRRASRAMSRGNPVVRVLKEKFEKCAEVTERQRILPEPQGFALTFNLQTVRQTVGLSTYSVHEDIVCCHFAHQSADGFSRSGLPLPARKQQPRPSGVSEARRSIRRRRG